MSGSYANPFTWEQAKKGPFCHCWRFRFIPRPSPACAAQTSQKTTTKQHPTRPRRARWTEEAPHPLRVDGDDRGEPDVATTGALVGPLAQRRHRRIGVSQPAGERQVGGGGRGGPRRRRGRGRCSSADVVVFETLRRTGSLLRGTRNGGEDAASPPRGRRRSGSAGRGNNGGGGRTSCSATASAQRRFATNGERQVGGGGGGGPRRRRGRGRRSFAAVVVFATLRRTGSILRGTRNGGEDAASPTRGRRRSGRAGRGDNRGGGRTYCPATASAQQRFATSQRAGRWAA